MGNYYSIGNSGFTSIIKGRYVDKTAMISYINSTLGTPEKLSCVSRPRRFGKSFAAKMLCAYYDKSCDSSTLFDGLQISHCKDYQEHLNKYHVIYLDMTSFLYSKADDKNIVGRMVDSVLSELFDEFPQVKQDSDLPTMLSMIAEAINQKFIIIIDEWDVVFREAKEDKKLQEEYIYLLRRLFKDSGKTDKMIEAAYMTGILPIKKYGTQSAMTDFLEFTMLTPEPLEEYVGFTENEVRKLCEGSFLEFSELERWYDGYLLGNDVHIYSPKSVMDAIARKRIDSYWTQSETYEALRMYIDMNLDGLKESIIDMLSSKKCKINTRTFQNDMTTIHSKDDVLTLLVHLGYLTYDYRTKSVSIPNEEVREEFLNALENGSRKELYALIMRSDQLFMDTLAGDEDAVADAIEEVHDLGTAQIFYNNEQALRSVIRFAYISCIDNYQIIEELPGGKGYADVAFIPKRNCDYPVMVVELKWNKTAKAAIEQIKDRKYPAVLEGLSEEILLVGINYDEKTKRHSCKIERWKSI